MELKIMKEDFLKALTKAQGVVEKRHTMAVLSNVLLNAEKGNLVISATDLEVGLETNVPAQTLKPGKITVSCRSLHDVVREAAAAEIKLTLGQNDRVELSSGSARFNLPGLPAKDFPSISASTSKPWALDCKVLGSMLDKTAYAVSADETRHNLAGILIQGVGSKRVRVVATDGHRLSMVEEELEGGDWSGVKVIIPRKGVSELRKMASAGGTLFVSIGDKNLTAKREHEAIHIRLVDAEYPDYERVLPSKADRVCGVERAQLIGALRRVSILSNERSRAVVLTLSPSVLEISISNPDLGEAREEVAVEYLGDKLNVGFNARYILDILEVMQDEKINLLFQSELAPCMIKSEKDKGFVGIVMPMRI